MTQFDLIDGLCFLDRIRGFSGLDQGPLQCIKCDASCSAVFQSFKSILNGLNLKQTLPVKRDLDGSDIRCTMQRI